MLVKVLLFVIGLFIGLILATLMGAAAYDSEQRRIAELQREQEDYRYDDGI